MKEMLFNGFLILILVSIILIIFLILIIKHYKNIKLFHLKEKMLTILNCEIRTLRQELFNIEQNIIEFDDIDLSETNEYNLHLNDLKNQRKIINRKVNKIVNKIVDIKDKKITEVEIFNIIKKYCLNYDHKVEKINFYNNITDYSNLFTKYDDILKIQNKILFNKKIKLLYLKTLCFIKGV